MEGGRVGGGGEFGFVESDVGAGVEGVEWSDELFESVFVGVEGGREGGRKGGQCLVSVNR